MAERLSTSTRMDRARKNGRVSRIENGHLKRKERASRDKRMVELIQKGKFPYTPAIMSWVSVKLGVRSVLISDEQIKALAKVQ